MNPVDRDAHPAGMERHRHHLPLDNRAHVSRGIAGVQAAPMRAGG